MRWGRPGAMLLDLRFSIGRNYVRERIEDGGRSVEWKKELTDHGVLRSVWVRAAVLDGQPAGPGLCLEYLLDLFPRASSRLIIAFGSFRLSSVSLSEHYSLAVPVQWLASVGVRPWFFWPVSSVCILTSQYSSEGKKSFGFRLISAFGFKRE